MHRSCCRLLLMALAVVTFLTFAPGEASAAAPCTVGITRNPIARAELWRGALERFTAMRPDLTAEQAQFLDDAVQLGDHIATLRQDARAQAAFARRAARIMERARELFSHAEVGELFSSMGPTQVWLAAVVASTPYCNCTGTGSCEFGGGGPSGTCEDGCVTWTGDDGRRRDGICSADSQVE